MSDTKMVKNDQFIDLKKLVLYPNIEKISLNKCRVIFDDQGLENIKDIKSISIKGCKVYNSQKFMSMLHSINKAVPRVKIIGNYIEEIPHTSRL